MKIYKILFFLLIISTSSLIAQRLPNLFMPKTREEFFRIADRHDLVIVNFVDYDRSKDKPRDVEEMQEVFFDVADEDPFANTVAFVGINLKDTPSLYDNIKSLRDAMKDQNTIVMLFYKGKPIKKRTPDVSDVKVDEKTGQAADIKKISTPVFKKGFVRKRDLEAFINKYFGDIITQMLEEMEESELRQSEQEVHYVQQQPTVRYVQRPVRTYYYPDYQRSYYPSYGYRPYRRWGWGGPGFGIGFGFGGGRRWGGWGGRGGGIGFGFGF